MTDNNSLQTILCCLFKIPQEEQKSRIESLSLDSYIIPIHENYGTDLNDKKDIVIQSMFKRKQWNRQKKKTNLFEKINSYPVGIIQFNTISRAFFKMIEMGDFFSDFIAQEKPLRFLNIAEAPGGFIQALQHIRDSHPDPEVSQWSIFDYYVANTIEFKSKHSHPTWAPFITKNNRVKIVNGDVSDDSTLANIKAVDNKRFDMVTADCGIDVTDQFEHQELIMYPLLLSQIIVAIQAIHYGGVFVLKIFETDLYHTKELLYLLGILFNQVILVKPRTSRPLNCEKYVICKNFLINDTKIRKHIVDILKSYRGRTDYSKGSLWKKSIPEECMYLFHGYTRYCKEITARHLQLVLKKIGDKSVKLQNKEAELFSKRYNLPLLHTNINSI